MPPAPILSGGLHLSVVVVSVTSSTVRCWGALVGAMSIKGKVVLLPGQDALPEPGRSSMGC